MRHALRMIHALLVTFGLDVVKAFRAVRGLPYYIRNFFRLKTQEKHTANVFPFGTPYPCLDDRFSQAGEVAKHYFHQDLLVAQRIFQNNPVTHVDVGSRIDGFVSHVASFRTIEVLDIRPIPHVSSNIKFIQCDLMEPLENTLLEYCDSVSCLHAMEHFGLGRYGDQVNYDGYLLGIENLDRMLKRDGKLYFSVPIGSQRIEFDAHRVFALSYVLEIFHEAYRIDHFSFVDDQDNLHQDINLTEKEIRNNCGCTFGCGIFEMTKY